MNSDPFISLCSLWALLGALYRIVHDCTGLYHCPFGVICDFHEHFMDCVLYIIIVLSMLSHAFIFVECFSYLMEKLKLSFRILFVTLAVGLIL